MAERTYSSTHPLLPPTTEDDRLNWLRLLRSRRVGPATFYRLMGEHGSAGAALDHLPEIARAAGVENYAPASRNDALREMRQGQRAGAQLVFRGDPAYPAALADLPDAPPMLWALGDTSLLRRPCVALVGARNASSLGARLARRLAEDLCAAGFVVVSGLARGIDREAHLAALDHGTIAVQAGGVDVIYPQENRALSDDIAAKGLRLSEQPPGMQPTARHFPMRNRIISGLSLGVVVVEAALRSGSLITARDALDQGREVMAVPGHPMDPRAGGCNALIRDGAHLVRHADDVIEALQGAAGLPLFEAAHPPMAEPSPQPAPDGAAAPDAEGLHASILARLSVAPVAEDALIRDLGQPPARIVCALTDLELDGAVTRQAGGLIARAS